MTSYRTVEGDSIDLICWRHYGIQAGAVEAVMEANPGLAGRGPILPLGLTIILPVLKSASVKSSIRLWD